MKTTWKILGIESPDGELITQAKYLASAQERDQVVETEGYWTFREPKMNTPLADVTEEMIVAWVQDEIGNAVEGRLAEQMAALKKQRVTPLPWMPQVFTPEI